MTNKRVSAAALLRFHSSRGSQEAPFAKLKSHPGLDYLPSRRQVGNQVYMLCNLIAQALGREFQFLATPPRTAQNTATRTCLWAVKHVETLRKRIIQRAA